MIGIIGFCDLCYMQYLNKYTNILDDINVKYDVIYWNRDINSRDTASFAGNAVPFHYATDTKLPFRKKISSFLKYAFFVRKKIRTQKYEKLIVLTTQAAVPLCDLLLLKYRKKYIYDYRDITKEKISHIYTRLVKSLYKNSYSTMISSKGFLKELNIPDTESIVISHNRQFACKHSNFTAVINKNAPIRVVYWGIVRQVEHNKKICDIFGHDPRFTVTYHGSGFYEELSEYCKARGYTNIGFTGKYSQDEIPRFVSETDIILASYENDSEQKPALPVKLYDAVYYHIPMLVTEESYLATFTTDLRGVFSIDFNDNDAVTDKICDWYRSLKADEVNNDFDKFEEHIYSDDLMFERKLRSFVNI